MSSLRSDHHYGDDLIMDKEHEADFEESKEIGKFKESFKDTYQTFKTKDNEDMFDLDISDLGNKETSKQ